MQDENTRFDQRIVKTLNRLGTYYDRDSKLSLSGKIAELRELRVARASLEEQLGDADFKIALLESLPEVAGYRVSKSEFAISLLHELREKGDVAYRDFTDGIEEVHHSIYLHYLRLLETAEFIEIKPDLSYGRMDFILKLTEKGRAAEYPLENE